VRFHEIAGWEALEIAAGQIFMAKVMTAEDIF
jgi:hypothetical protein